MGSPRRWRGSAAACPRPRRGRSRAAPGRSRQPLQPPCRASAHTGGRGPPFPPRRPLGRSSGAVLRRPRLRRVGALACSAPCLSAAWSFFPRRFLPQPSPLPPPVPLPLRGRGKRKRLTPAAAGTGGARLPQRTKKPPRLWLLPPAKRHKTRILFKNIGPTKRARPSGSAPFSVPGFCPALALTSRQAARGKAVQASPQAASFPRLGFAAVGQQNKVFCAISLPMTPHFRATGSRICPHISFPERWRRRGCSTARGA